MKIQPYILGPDQTGTWVVVRGDSVTDQGAGEPPLIEGATTIGCSSGRIQRGDVNAHTHLYSGLAPLGMPEPTVAPENFVQILERVWWKLDRALDAQALRAAARYYVANALRFGTTTLIDHHESPGLIEGSLDVLAEVCESLGMRAVFTYGATERNGGRLEARRGLLECRRFIENNPNPALFRGVVGLHASFTVSDETIRESGDLCRTLGVPLHVHLAEDVADVTDAQQRGYDGPLERLAALGALVPGTLLAHGVHLTEQQAQFAESRGCWLLSNPRSNKGNRVGYGRALHHTTHVALGTDGYPADMEAERLAGQEEATAHGCSPDDVLLRSRQGPVLVHELFSRPATTLKPLVGSVADLVVREPDGQSSQVFVNGRWVVQHGALVSGNADDIRDEAQQQADRLWKRMVLL